MVTKRGTGDPRRGSHSYFECEVQAAQMWDAVGFQTKGFDFKCKPAQQEVGSTLKVLRVQYLSPLSGEIHLHPLGGSVCPWLWGAVARVTFDALKGQPLMSKLYFHWDGRMQPGFPDLNWKPNEPEQRNSSWRWCRLILSLFFFFCSAI